MRILVIGRGIVGLWQALTCARRGHDVVLASDADAKRAASWYAGGMLAPGCEGETAEPIVAQLGVRSIAAWKEIYPQVISNGSLVLSHPRDRAELQRFERQTEGGERVDPDRLTTLEPDLEGRFRTALFFPDEAHLTPRTAMQFLDRELQRLGVTCVDISVQDGDLPHAGIDGPRPDHVLDCRGLGARERLDALRGVRGEMAVLRAREVTLSRPVRLLHPRFPLYVVPWGNHHFMIGATVVEREDAAPVTARAGLELLGHAYALHSGFAEAEIIEFSAGVRPTFPDNTPKIVVSEDRIYINGVYRHGFLTAPALAELVAEFIETGATHSEVFSRADRGQW
ncbi:MAG: FAD-dependent oxidoreductase [Pseudomonadota bacterium]